MWQQWVSVGVLLQTVVDVLTVYSYISLETERLPQLVAAAIVLGSCLYLVISWYASLRKSDRSLTFKRVLWIHCCLYCGLIVLCIGRVHMHSWRRLVAPYAHYLVSDKFCCTQAILYTAQAARDLATYLDNTSCNETYHKDDALWKFTSSRYLIQPNVFEHVGLWSSVRHGFVNPHTLGWYCLLLYDHRKPDSMTDRNLVKCHLYKYSPSCTPFASDKLQTQTHTVFNGILLRWTWVSQLPLPDFPSPFIPPVTVPNSSYPPE